MGIGEVLTRILAKAVTAVLKPDLKKAAGGLQLCVGQEAAVHAMVDIFEDESCHTGRCK